MRSFEITKHPDELLRRRCRGVLLTDMDYIRSEMQRMMYMMDEQGGCAIAAPQAGIDLRFFVAPVQLFGTPVIINPFVGEYSILDSNELIEGCLSLPGERHLVKRYTSCRMEYFDQDFVFQTKMFEGFLAQVAQHETDHLNGILIKDISKKVVI